MVNDLISYFQHWKDLPHQRAAVQELWQAVPESLKKPDSSWVQTWRAAGKQEKPRTLANPLQVRYFSQRDSATAHALRMCFSSSCAMLLETLRPGTLSGPNGDDAYLGRVLRYGDTTDTQAQLRALASYGIKATFTQKADWSLVQQQIDKGIPVPLGFLHHGSASKPGGGGHWLCAIGYTPDALIVHDPFGEINLAAGGYLNNWGAKLRYSRQNFGPRWMVEGSGTGWAIVAEP